MKKVIIIGLVVIAFAYLILKTVAAQVPSNFVTKIPGRTYLSDLDLKPTSGTYITDSNPEKHKIRLKDITYEKGLCTTSDFKGTYKLNWEYKEFSCVVGHHPDYPEYKGTLTFRILVDGKEAYESAPLKADETDKVDISVNYAQSLTLSVKDNGISSSYVVWADAGLK